MEGRRRSGATRARHPRHAGAARLRDGGGGGQSAGRARTRAQADEIRIRSLG